LSAVYEEGMFVRSPTIGGAKDTRTIATFITVSRAYEVIRSMIAHFVGPFFEKLEGRHGLWHVGTAAGRFKSYSVL